MDNMSKFSQIINNARNTQERITSLTIDRAQKIDDFKKYLEQIDYEISNIQTIYQEQISQIISIRLIDLLNELCSITKTKLSCLDVNVTTNMFLNKLSYDSVDDLTCDALQKRINSNLEISIVDKSETKRNPLNIRIYFPLDLTSLMANGETLFNSLSLKSLENDFEIVLEKNIGEYVCNFSVDNIINQTLTPICEPAGVLKQAIINCYENNKTLNKNTEKFSKEIEK